MPSAPSASTPPPRLKPPRAEQWLGVKPMDTAPGVGTPGPALPPKPGAAGSRLAPPIRKPTPPPLQRPLGVPQLGTPTAPRGQRTIMGVAKQAVAPTLSEKHSAADAAGPTEPEPEEIDAEPDPIEETWDYEVAPGLTGGHPQPPVLTGGHAPRSLGDTRRPPAWATKSAPPR